MGKAALEQWSAAWKLPRILLSAVLETRRCLPLTPQVPTIQGAREF